MELEKRKIFSLMAKALAPGYSWCKRCELPWLFVQGHSVMTSTHTGIFAICEDCWHSISKEKRFEFYKDLWDSYPRESDYEAGLENLRVAILEDRPYAVMEKAGWHPDRK